MQDSILREPLLWVMIGVFCLFLLTIYLIGIYFDEQSKQAYQKFANLHCSEMKSILTTEKYDHGLMSDTNLIRIYTISCIRGSG